MKRPLFIICLAILAGYFYAGLYPFDFFPRNQVSWLPEGGGIVLGSHTVVRSARPVELGGSGGEVTIEICFEPLEESRDRVRPLLSIYDGDLPENLLIAQWKSRAVVRAAIIDARGRRRFREIDVRNGMRPGVRTILTMTSGACGTAVYLEGILAHIEPKLRLRPDNLEGSLLLGDSSNGEHGWRGKVCGLALFGRALSPPEVERHYRLFAENRAGELRGAPGLAGLYLFDDREGQAAADWAAGNALEFPKYSRPVNPVFLRPPWRDSIHPFDITINVLGFVPFGLFYFLYRAAIHPGRMRANFLWALLVSAAVSAGIEVLQVWLPSRSSSMTDLICNIGGALCGIALAAGIVGIRHSKRIADTDEHGSTRIPT